MRKSILLACAGLALALLSPTGAMAQRGDDWWREVEPWLDGRAGRDVKKVRLATEFFRLRTAVRSANRRGALSLRETDRYYSRLDRVGRFLRDDRNLSDKEYRRRRDDLDNVARDLERAGVHRSARGNSRL
jgi:hypothetical protein